MSQYDDIPVNNTVTLKWCLLGSYLDGVYSFWQFVSFHSMNLHVLCTKKRSKFNLLWLCQNLTDLQNSFTVRKRVKPKTKPYKTDHHTFSMLRKLVGKLESKFGENCTVLLKMCFILLVLTRWNLNCFSQFFHCCKKKKIINTMSLENNMYMYLAFCTVVWHTVL